MSAKSPGRRSSGRVIITRTGKQLKINRNLGQKWLAMRDAKTRRKVDRMRGLPKSRFKRLAWRLRPKHLAAYWFSRDGGIMALKITGIGILVLFVLTLAVFAYFRKDLPDIKDISGSNLGGSISYYDRSGKTLLWQDYNAVKRVPVASDSISKYIKDATIATEDRNFYSERGFDLKGIARAAYVNIIKRGHTQGGSTITQQLVKLTTQDFNQGRNLSVKAKELILAIELERTYTKEEILTGYLNAAPYGGVDYGVQAASSDYFHKDAKKLTLAEAAMLAAIPKSPSVYSPYNKTYFDRKAFLARYDYVLDSMAETGKITKAQADAAKKVDILAEVHPQQTKYAGIKAPYFVLAAKNQLLSRCSAVDGNCAAGGWRVITTLDMGLQKLAEKTVQDNRANALSHGADEEALVAEDVKTGQMVALVGGTDFNNPDHGAINYAQWNISPGSSFKPYDYASLIENSTNAGAGSVLYDSQGALPGYACTIKGSPPPRGNSNCLQDYDFRYPGPLSLRYALGGSRNVPAVKAMLTVGTDKVIGTANSMMAAPNAYKCFTPGADVNTATKADESQCYGASALGDGAYLHLDNHVNGLATLARMGSAIPASYILQIKDSANKTLFQWKQPKGTQVIRQDTAYIVNNMASDPNASYLPFGYYKWHNYNGWHTAIKTGTTNNGFDGLMMAWNTQYAVGSWVGYHTRNQALAGAMEYSTTPLARGFMTAALDRLHKTPDTWKEPGDIQHLPAFVVRNHVGIGSVEPSPGTEIYPSWYKQQSTTVQNVTMDKVSGKIATSCTPALAKQKPNANQSASKFSIDIFYPPGQGSSASTTTTASDDVHSCSDSSPTIDSFFVGGQDASGGKTINCDSTCQITTNVSAGTHPFNDGNYPQYPGTVNLVVNGKVVQSKKVSSSTTVSFTYSGSGQVTMAIQVIDSVLYSATSSSSTIKFAAAAQPLAITQPADNSHPGPNLTLKWSGGSPTYTVLLNGSEYSGSCTDTSATQCSVNIPLGLSTLEVDDSDGDSAQITVIRP